MATLCRNSRISSMPRLLAAVDLQDVDVVTGRDAQAAIATIARNGGWPLFAIQAFGQNPAAEVLPTPRAPVNRYACPTRLLVIAAVRARATCSCPTSSAKAWGRYRRATTTYSRSGRRQSRLRLRP